MNLPVQSMGVIDDSERNHLASSIADSEHCDSEMSRVDDIEENIESKLLGYSYEMIDNHSVLAGGGREQSQI